jgi:hypothetical protein
MVLSCRGKSIGFLQALKRCKRVLARFIDGDLPIIEGRRLALIM